MNLSGLANAKRNCAFQIMCVFMDLDKIKTALAFWQVSRDEGTQTKRQNDQFQSKNHNLGSNAWNATGQNVMDV